MKNGKLLDLYSDYLISAFGQTTATGLASLLNGAISHDQVQRSLAADDLDAALPQSLVNLIDDFLLRAPPGIRDKHGLFMAGHWSPPRELL
jgi:hypothetical protein